MTNRSTVIATAGHVDHGKSTLVRALTGVDPDRLPQERSRGMTLDLGFASRRLPSGHVASFVDVPGHERLVPTMVMGASNAAAFLLVVDAREGWRAQTEEHRELLELLGVWGGVVALTKVSGLLPDDLAAVRAQVARRLAESPMANAEVVPVDALTGYGIARLLGVLDRSIDRVREPVDQGNARLWVDRSFVIRGAGSVITGTLQHGGLRVGERVWFPANNLSARIRALHEHGEPIDVVGPGRRVAVNLVGVSSKSIARGDVMIRKNEWNVASRVRGDLCVLASAGAIRTRGSWTIHIGTHFSVVRLRLTAPIAPGSTGQVHLQLPVPLPLQPGDRFVIRDTGRGTTAAGGTITEIERTRSAVPRQREAHLLGDLARHPFLDRLRSSPFPPPQPGAISAQDLGQLRGAGLALSHDGFWFAAETLRDVAKLIRTRLDRTPAGITVRDVCDELGMARRPTIALLEILDARGVTTRRGDVRVQGQRSLLPDAPRRQQAPSG